MQNSLQFYPEYNSYPTGDAFLSNPPDTSIQNDGFAPCITTSMNTNQMPVMSQPTTSGVITSKKRKATVDTDASYSPASIYSDNSNYSDTSYPTFSHRSTDFSQGMPSHRRDTITTTSKLTTSAEEGSSDDNDDDDEENDLARKREKHTQVEAQRRALEKAHFKELSMLITDRNDSKSTKLHHLDLLKIAADQISQMNTRHEHDPLRPSNLTDNELNFLTIEASNSFLFVTTVEPPIFRIIHVTDSINRILNVTRDQWLRQNFLSFIHPEDLLQVQSQLIPINQRIGMKVHLDCRLKQGNTDTYSSVIIDGMTKMIDQSLKPLQTNAPGFLAFIGICHLPLITKYSETNMCLYKDTQSLTFRCRCSPHDWKIFLIDRSVSTLPSVSYDVFRQKSILEFIPANEQGHILQALLRSTTASTTETMTCHLMHPALQTLLLMTLEIKSFFNPVIHRADFIELTFKSVNNSINPKLETSIFDFINDTKEIEQLLETESSASTQQQLNNNHPTTQTAPYYYSNDWTTKHELF
jgi:hypothetical protein